MQAFGRRNYEIKVKPNESLLLCKLLISYYEAPTIQ